MAPRDPELLKGDLITVAVGTSPTGKAFRLHEKLVTSFSGFFGAALRARPGFIPLRHEDPEPFADLVRWLYEGDVPSRPTDQDFLNRSCRLWILGDYYIIPQLQDEVARKIQKSATETANETVVGPQPTWETMETVLDNTLESSALQRLIFDIAAIDPRLHFTAGETGSFDFEGVSVDILQKIRAHWRQLNICIHDDYATVDPSVFDRAELVRLGDYEVSPRFPKHSRIGAGAEG